jgi:hypothetical protein
MEVQEACDVMAAAHEILQKTEKIKEFSVNCEHIANHLRVLQDKYDALLTQNYVDK